MKNQESFSTVKSYIPFHSQFDPCPPIGKKYYSTPPNLYLGFQPPNLPQFSPYEALKKGTLWPVFYDYYENPYKKGGS
ncbi:MULTISPECIES: spore coat associated protein CotJA [Metabacillus]|uniref:Spore coat associated protein CotJA n=1 Tax=Metabacillus hrfriensis TaxID=3048891 RepID=A0ACD4REQ6_9BACI|nr:MULTISPECIES: spore coat associated protein CotJA [Metabacillus]UAL53357.1 spore coat associated protein CotJA [Metabacillus dongyingensis]USK29679.1 spore coat associated protein CotJA [Bacillus sp. CMF21]WHZ58923.1 spore coat associated protein CotJA [Metabacillus sp. CT-WN-B3]